MLWQLIINGIIAGAGYALVGIGFALIYNVGRFFHFAHGILFTVGAYTAFLCNQLLGLPLFLSVPVAIAVTAASGCLLNLVILGPITRRGGSPLVLLLASLGLYIVIQNVISLCFGDDIKTLSLGTIEKGLDFFGARVTPVQISIVISSAMLLIAVALFLRTTGLGKAMRAVSSNAALAEVCGISSRRLVLYAFGIGSALAGIAGVLAALDVNMTPTMGLNALMMGIVAVIIGGSQSVSGIALGALLIGLAQHVGAWKLGTQWQDSIVFIILFTFLLVRPEGFLGKKIRKAAI